MQATQKCFVILQAENLSTDPFVPLFLFVIPDSDEVAG